MRPDVIAPPLISAAPATAIASTDTEPLAAGCALCGQPMDPEPDGSEPMCTDCRAETTKATKTTRKEGPPMLTPDMRRQIVTAAVEAAVLTAGADFTSGGRHNTLTTADKAILGDLGRRLAVRCALVQRIAEQNPRDHKHAAATFAAAFSSAYDAHLHDLSTGCQRDAGQHASDVLVALDATSRAREGR